MSKYDNLQIQALWNEEDEHFSNEQYYNLLMEQYKIYVEMTDRASFRRTLVNLFFMIVNILIVSLMALGISRSTSELQMGLMLVPLLGLLAICYSWWRLVRFYRHTVAIKEKVVGELEKRLPSSPMWQAERSIAVEKGALNPLKRMEIILPYIFAALYIATYIYLLVAPPWVH